MRGGLRDLVAHSFQNLNVLFLSIFLGHTARGNMVQVFEPLKVTASYTTTVGQHIWHNDNVSLKESLFGAEGSWAVGSLEDNFTVEEIAVVLVDGLLLCGRDQDVALFLHEFGGVKRCLFSSTTETHKGTLGEHVVLSIVNVHTVRVVDS